PGPMPHNSPRGIRSILSSLKPTTSASITCPAPSMFDSIWHISPILAWGPRPSIKIPIPLLTLPYTLTGSVSLTTDLHLSISCSADDILDFLHLLFERGIDLSGRSFNVAASG